MPDSSILIVDDEPDIRETLTEALDLYGYTAAGVGNGAEALVWLRTHRVPPCLLFLDLMMPNLNGIEFRHAQLAQPSLAKIPVVVMTGALAISRDPVLAGLEVLTKPIDFATILDRVQRYCGPRAC